jgi:hypothetical protein
MPNETTRASAIDSEYPKFFDSMIEPEMRPLNVMGPFMKFRGPEHSNVYRFTFLGATQGSAYGPGAATTKNEGSAMNNTQLVTSGADVTAGTIGMQATITDEHTETSLYSTYGTYGPELIRSLAQKWETDAAALLAGGSNTVGTTNVALTLATFLSASIGLAGRDAVGQQVSVLHTINVGHLKQDMASSAAAVHGNPNIQIGNVDASNLTGYQGTWYGVPVYQTTLVPTANGTTDRQGATFIVGQAFGHYQIRPPKSETMRELGVGTGIAVTQRYGVGELRDTWITTITARNS